MSLTQAEVEHIALLARLELSEEEKNLYRVQLSAILEYAARLQQVDASRVSAGESSPLTQAPLRDDVPVQALDVKTVLSNAPQVEENQFRVPPVLE